MTTSSLRLTDMGLGMSKETLQKLWMPLFTTKSKGMGFGLAITKRFIEAHGGSITVTSALEKGTTVTMIIPVKPRDSSEVEIWAVLPANLPSIKHAV